MFCVFIVFYATETYRCAKFYNDGDGIAPLKFQENCFQPVASATNMFRGKMLHRNLLKEKQWQTQHQM